MTRFNFREAALLASSGELGPTARREFLNYIRDNPDACSEYEDIRLRFEALAAIPVNELSADERQRIPADIKSAIARILDRRQLEKRAQTRRTLIRYALAGVASAAAMVVLMASLSNPRFTSGRPNDRDSVARLNATIDRLAGIGEQAATPYEQAVNDVEASIRQLQTDSPTLAEVHDKDMDNLLDVLATLPSDQDEFGIVVPSGLPGAL